MSRHRSEATPNEARRLKALEDENNRLKRMLADAMLDSEPCPPLVQGQWRAGPS